jgi:hypothetical protein
VFNPKFNLTYEKIKLFKFIILFSILYLSFGNTILFSQMREFTFDLSNNNKWTGTVTELRLDPINGGCQNCYMDIDNIQLVSDSGDTVQWDFNNGYQGWNCFQNGITLSAPQNGIMRITITGNDPYLGICNQSIDSKLYKTLKIRMNNQTGIFDGELFFKTNAGLFTHGLIFPPTPATAVGASPQVNIPSGTWTATDHVGRTLTDNSNAPAPKTGKYVGIFYFLWMEDNRTGPHDITEILKANPNAINNINDPGWGGFGAFHHWGKPMHGYYRNSDKWVIRKHMRMLTDAGVDMLLFDVSNNYIYKQSINTILEVLRELKSLGEPYPRLAFHGHPTADQVVHIQDVYNSFYASGANDDFWFKWNGKPLYVAVPSAPIGATIQNYFTWRTPYWQAKNPKVGSFTLDAYYPTPKSNAFMLNTKGEVEQTSVVVASSIAGGTMDSQPKGGSRAWHGDLNGFRDTSPGAVDRGFMAEQNWEVAVNTDAPFVLVYCFNEWLVQKYSKPNDNTKPMFVDQFSQEYSKDIEPMENGHKDAYYLQMASWIRKYKGIEAVKKASSNTITVNGDFSDWTAVTPEFNDHKSDVQTRSWLQYGDKNVTLTENTGRNDIASSKITKDAKNLYAYVKTVASITNPTANDKNWMVLMLDTDKNGANGFLGFDYAINRNRDASGKSSVEKYENGAWTNVGWVSQNRSNTEMEIAIPLSLIPNMNSLLRFQWTDNVWTSGIWSDPYKHGDAAPDNAFKYQVNLTNPSLGVDDFDISEVARVYPNPSKDGFFKVELKNLENASLVVFDLLGKKLNEYTVQNVNGKFNTELDLSKLESGIYILNLTQRNITKSTKLVIE